MHVMSEEGKAAATAVDPEVAKEAIAQPTVEQASPDLHDLAKRKRLEAKARLKHLFGKYNNVFKSTCNSS